MARPHCAPILPPSDPQPSDRFGLVAISVPVDQIAQDLSSEPAYTREENAVAGFRYDSLDMV